MKIRIYQIDIEKDHKARNIYRDFDPARFQKSLYDLVFDGEVKVEGLEEVYRYFNGILPEGYTGRSLSISDIVEVVESEQVPTGFHYCQAVGWVEITSDWRAAK